MLVHQLGLFERILGGLGISFQHIEHTRLSLRLLSQLGFVIG
jgi:hypothetical protein